MERRLSPARRWLLRGLVLLLVPVVVFATPHVATASTKVSGQKIGTFGYDAWTWGGWANCKFQAFYSVQDTPESSAEGPRYLQSIKVNSGNCDTAPSHNIEGASLGLDFNGVQPDGASCSAGTGGTLGTDEVFGPLAGSFTGLTPHPVEQLCEVTEFCWSLYKAHPVLPGDAVVSESGCVPFAMGVPVLPAGLAIPTGCPTGNPTGTPAPVFVQEGSYWNIHFTIPWKWESGAEAFSIAPVDANGTVHTDYAADVTPGSGTTALAYVKGVHNVYNPQAWIPSAISGYSIYQKGNRSITPGLQPLEYGGHPSNAYQVSQHGWTQANACVWYFGDKIRDHPGTANDTPAGPVGGPVGGDDPDPAEDTTAPAPVDHNEGCGEGFSIFNPVSWASAGFCEVVSALSSLLKALGRGLAAVVDAIGGVASAILNGLRNLFVPSDGYLDAAVGDVRDDFEDTTPGAYVAAFGDLTPGAVSGCNGLTLDVPLPGIDTDPMQIGAACGGFMANVAALVRLGLSAVVVVGGGLACVRALGSGFGWRPGIGRGDAA